jgi:hypothetical protein
MRNFRDVVLTQKAQLEEQLRRSYVERRLPPPSIQVCWDLSDPHTRTREFRALTKAGAELHCDELLCLTRGPTTDEDFTWNGRTGHIRVVPIEKWLAQA